jgi:signal transduction histidine kinase
MSLRGPADKRGRFGSTPDDHRVGENEPPHVLRELLDRHVTQQLAVARLSRLALRASLDDVIGAVAEALLEGLHADSAKVLELVNPEGEFELKASAGRKSDADSKRRVRTNPATAAGHALRHNKIILIDDFDNQDEFERSELLNGDHARSSLVVRIPGLKHPFGVLGAQAREPGSFSEDDFEFVRTVANLVGEAVERERTDQHRRRTYEELHGALTAREEMLAMISHDLRSPASAIKLSLEVVRRAVHDPQGPIKPEQVERAIGKANSNIDRMMTLMDDLLAMSRAETDSFEIEWEDVDLREVIDEVFFDYEKAIESSGSDVEVQGEDSLIGEWDWVRLQQIISNLLSNAIKYGQGNPIMVALSADEQKATLQIVDHGRGIPKQQQKRIFERFVRIDHRENDQMDDSYGLGLWIVKRIVDALHGTIELDSTPGEGTTFTVRLPRQRNNDDDR